MSNLFENSHADFMANAQNDWLKTQNAQGLENFKKQGFPTKKWEEFRYINLKPIAETEFALANDDAKSDLTKLNEFIKGDVQNLIFVNGKFQADISNTEGIIAGQLKDHMDKIESFSFEKAQTPFEDLNQAYLSEGVYIEIPKDTVVKKTINIVHYYDENFKGKMAHPRNIIVARKFSKASIFETYLSYSNEEEYFNNVITDVVVEDGAKLGHTKAQLEGLKAYHIGAIRVNIGRDGHYNSFVFNVGSKTSRNDSFVNLNAEGAYAVVNGLYALREDQHSDNYSVIDHRKPHTESFQLYKGILDGKSHGVFSGKVLVQKDAQKINSEQLNKNLLLSKTAKVDTKPMLEIDADDVKCAHGATVGQMSDEELFYLQSRGINAEQARIMLGHAFCNDVLMHIDNEYVREKLAKILFDQFEKYTFIGEA